MTPTQFFERLQQLKDGDAAYITITKENGKLYYNGEIIEEENKKAKLKEIQPGFYEVYG